MTGGGRACRSAVRKEAAAVNLFRVSQEGLARPAACLRGPGGFAPRRLPPYVSPRQPSGFPSLPPQLPLPALALPPPASLSSKLPSTVYHFHCRVFLSLYCPSLSGSRRFLPQVPRTAAFFILWPSHSRPSFCLVLWKTFLPPHSACLLSFLFSS